MSIVLSSEERMMQAIYLSLIDEGEITEIIKKLQRMKKLSEAQRLWIMYKVSQLQAGRNIIAIAQQGIEIMLP